VIDLFARLCCAIGLHAWWYEVGSVPHRRYAASHELVRICATCPAKQRLVGAARGQRWIPTT